MKLKEKMKRYTQWGIASIALLLPSLIFFLVLLLRLETINTLFYVYLVMSVILFFALLCFHNLTITIDDTSVSFKLGIGLINKRYKIKNIKSCKPISYSIFRGFGIRVFPNGVLYNVSGLKAIELQFYDRNTVVQIGTNQPEEITQLIQSLIGGNKITNRFITPTNKQQYGWLLAVLIFSVVMSITSIETFTDTKVEMKNEELLVKGLLERLTISISEIEQVDTVSHPLSISQKIKGLDFAGTKKGKFKQTNGSQIMLFVKKKHKPYILIQLKNNKMPVYLNFRDKQKTINLYNQLKNNEHKIE